MYCLLKNYLSSKTNFTEADIAFICSHFKRKSTRRNAILVNYIDVCMAYYFINKGATRIYTINSEGIETSRYFAFEGMFCIGSHPVVDQKSEP